MLDRHAVQEMVRAGLPLRAVARQLGVSHRTIRRIVHEAPVTTLTPAARVGRPPVDDDARQRIEALLTAEPDLPPGEIWRRLRDEKMPLGPSTVYRVRPSMGSVGDAYDNALAESFFASLECELLDRQSFHSPSEARPAIFQFIEGWHNPHRRHSALGQRSPINYERLLSEAA